MTNKRKPKQKNVIESLNGYGGVPDNKLRKAQQMKSATIKAYREQIAAEMIAMSLTSVKDIMSWDDEGNVFLKASKDIPEYAHRAIKKVVSTKRADGTTTTSVELHDKVRTLQTMAQAAGLLDSEANADKPSVIGFTVNAPVQEVEDDG